MSEPEHNEDTFLENEGKRAAELEAVYQASLSLTASLELPQVLNAILKSALKLLPNPGNSHIFLYDPEGGGRLTFAAARWADGTQNQPWNTPRKNGLTYAVARQAEMIVVPDMRTHPLFQDAPPDWSGAIVGLPLNIGQRVVGVMNISFPRPRTFAQAELRALRLLAGQAAIAIENARLFEQAATERRHLSLLYDIGREMAVSLDPDEILKRAITLTCQAMGGLFGEAFLFIPEEQRFSLRTLYGREPGWIPFLDRLLNHDKPASLVKWILENRQPVNIPDVGQDPRWLFIADVDNEVRSALAAPILQGENLLGLLCVFHAGRTAFSDEHMTLMQAICQQVGLALSNASRYQQAQRQLAEITLIQSLAQTFSQRLELEVLLDEVVEQLSRRLGYPQVEIFLKEGDFLVQRAFRGIDPHLASLPITKGIIGRVARTGQVALIPDVSCDNDYINLKEDTIAELAVPILRNAEVIGVINIQTDRPNQLGVQDCSLLQMLAGQISVALENAVLYERVRSHAVDLEGMVAQRTAELTELYKLSQEIGYQFSYDGLLHLLLRHLRLAAGCDLAMGSLTPGDAHLLSVETNRPISRSALAEIRAKWKQLFQTHGGPSEPVDKIKIEVIPAEGFQGNGSPIQEVPSLILAPVNTESRFSGLLILGSEKRDAFGTEQERLLSTFANQASSAIQRLEAILAAQQQHFESLVEHLPVGTLLFDPNFNLLVSNPLGKEILSILNGGEAVGVLKGLGPYHLEELLARQSDPLPIKILLEEPVRRIFAAQIRPVNGPAAGKAVQRRPAAGSPASRSEPAGLIEKGQWVLTLREITQESEYQARVQSQERLATVGQLAAGIAHDFNNIMAAIQIYTDLLQNEPDLADTSQEKLNIIQRQVQRASSLIRQILDFSRRSIMDQSALDLLPFIKELDKLLDRVLPETIRLELTYQPGEYWVSADPARLQQVFMNLALNARDAMPEGGVLRLALDRLLLGPEDIPPFPNMPPGEWILVSVADTGIGIAAEFLTHIFEPFFTTKPVGQGTGLGLAQVYGIVKKHDGYILVHSEAGQGACFTIYLPALHGPAGIPQAAEALDRLEGRGKTALVVEDDQATRQALHALLEAHLFQVLEAQNGLEALNIFEQALQTIDLVVSDVIMPGMGGIPLYRELVRQRPGTRMLFVTGHPLEGENQALLETGNLHWLQKPFSVNEFTQAVQKLLQA